MPRKAISKFEVSSTAMAALRDAEKYLTKQAGYSKYSLAYFENTKLWLLSIARNQYQPNVTVSLTEHALAQSYDIAMFRRDWYKVQNSRALQAYYFPLYRTSSLGFSAARVDKNVN